MAVNFKKTFLRKIVSQPLAVVSYYL